MTTATLEATGEVECVRLADGLLVRLGGAVDAARLPQLRRALLAPIPADCRDVVVDAGDVTAVDDAALAVLLAAHAWAQAHGARFLLSRSAAPLDECLTELDLAAALPRLSSLDDRVASAVVPLPRPSAD